MDALFSGLRTNYDVSTPPDAWISGRAQPRCRLSFSTTERKYDKKKYIAQPEVTNENVPQRNFFQGLGIREFAAPSL